MGQEASVSLENIDMVLARLQRYQQGLNEATRGSARLESRDFMSK